MRGLNEVYTGGLGSFGICAMVTSFLQMHPRIQLGHIGQMENLAILLIEFFDFYGKRFNYDKVGISIRDGGRYFIKVNLLCFLTCKSFRDV
jgi:non-canonical poly(A) RNA polymerase PAPD5/7